MGSWLEKKALSEKRNQLVEQAGSILKTAKTENREMSAEEDKQFNAIHNDVRSIEKQIEALDTQTYAEARLGRNLVEAPEVDKDAGQRAFTKWLRYGNENLSSEERTALRNSIPVETRTASGLGAANAGAEFVPPQFANTFVESLKAFGGVREAGATVFVTSSGADLTVPTMDDTSHTGEQLSINSAVADVDTNDPDTSSVTIKSFMYSSKVVRVPVQLMQDSAFPVETWLPKQLATRIGRALNTKLTTGNGTSEPGGICTATYGASLGKTASSSSAITYAEMLDLKHSVDPAYRTNGKFMFNDATLLALKKLTDNYGSPLWNRGDVANGIPASIDGTPYVINQDMASIGAGAKVALFGDFSYYWIMDVAQLQIVRLVEVYAPYLQVGFIAWARHGGYLTNTSAVKYLACAAGSA